MMPPSQFFSYWRWPNGQNRFNNRNYTVELAHHLPYISIFSFNIFFCDFISYPCYKMDRAGNCVGETFWITLWLVSPFNLSRNNICISIKASSGKYNTRSLVLLMVSVKLYPLKELSLKYFKITHILLDRIKVICMLSVSSFLAMGLYTFPL